MLAPSFARRARLLRAALLLSAVLSGCLDAQETPAPDQAPAADGALDAVAPDAANDATIADDATPRPDDGRNLDPDVGADLGPDLAPPDAGPDAAPDATPDLAPPPDLGDPRPPCDPPLRIEPAEAWARPFGLVTLRGAGGSGAHTFTLLEDVSGGLLNARTGAYLVGPVVGATDRVQLTDAACQGAAEAAVVVVDALAVSPARAEVPVGGGLTFATSGGSGRVAFDLAEARSGGAVDAAGRYTAGPSVGRDRVRVEDTHTGERVDVLIDVRDAVRLVADPPRLGLPVGVTAPLTVLGGSGVFDAALDLPEGADAEDAAVRLLPDLQVHAERPGRHRVLLTDRFLGLTTAVEVTAIAPLAPPLRRVGQAKAASVVLVPGDLDGDGHDEVLVGWPDADVTGVDAGAVFLYRGGPDGPLPEPVQVIGGRGRRDELGRALTVADFDGDGRPDLAVTAWLADEGLTDNGAVYLHRGLPDGTFSPEPFRTLSSPLASDQAGLAVTACDFNGDGLTDLALGAWLHEDRSLGAAATNQGAVLVWLGYADGFLNAPDQIIYGEVPEPDGTFAPRNDLRLGRGLAAADFDGDGRCDLVAYADQYKSAPERTNYDGMVQVFVGLPPDDLGPGGLSRLPTFTVTGFESGNNTRTGRRLAVGDLDGDGRPDLALGASLHDTPGANDRGAVAVFFAVPTDPAVNAVVNADAAPLVLLGDNAGDQFGTWISIEQADGQGGLDLVVGGPVDEVSPAASGYGAVSFYHGPLGPGADRPRDAVVGGAAAADQFGISAGIWRSVSGRRGLVAVDDRHDADGPDTGAVWFAPTDRPAEDPEAAPRRLTVPGNAGSGAQLGLSVALPGDLDGRGPTVAVGAPQHATPSTGLRGGSAWLLDPTDGITLRATFEDGPDHSNSDQLGYTVTGIGDFDGDGHPDLAVVRRLDERLSTLPAATWATEAPCGPRRTDGGSIFVHRGGPGIFDGRPDFALFGDVTSANLYAVGAADADGDGRVDLLVGSRFWDVPGANDAGGVALFRGRAADPDGRIVAVCQPDWSWAGYQASAHFGRSVTGLGDVDGDGCGDFAIGAPLEDFPSRSNIGSVRVLFGWGGAGCPAEPQASLIIGPRVSAQFGLAVAASDLDGDGRFELVAGAPAFAVNGVTVGGVFVVDGAWLAGRPRFAPTEDPLDGPAVTEAGAQLTVLEGRTVTERFGASVAAYAGVVAGGAPDATVLGVPAVGMARAWRWRPGAAPEPWAAFVGEAFRPGGLLGDAVALGPVAPGVLGMAVGGYEGSGLALDAGVVYVFALDAAPAP